MGRKSDALKREQTKSDYLEVLSSDAGKRIFGSIFYFCNLNRADFLESAAYAAYAQGTRAAGLMIANAIRELDPSLIGKCEKAFMEFEARFAEKEEEEGEDDG